MIRCLTLSIVISLFSDNYRLMYEWMDRWMKWISSRWSVDRWVNLTIDITLEHNIDILAVYPFIHHRLMYDK